MQAACTLSAYSNTVRRFTKVDRRSRVWRRRCELIKLYSKQLGVVTGTKLLDVERLAELTVHAEMQRTKMLEGEEIDTLALARIENTINRLS
jgi:hypothetical protein